MGIIRVLSEHVANQIAAGEVVERPASAVKELVENAIDAGSNRIDVVLEEGGLALIQVTDNGSGIATDDCERAFERHATSKISSGKDLFHVTSLGFRGEALPSIAAVSKLTCLTSTDSSGLGRRIVIEGGAVKAVEDAQASKGTTIQVKDLFYNTPARLKYMKTIQTEVGHVADAIYRFSLAHPQIAFTLRHNDNLLLQTLGNGDLLQVIAAVYGTGVAKSMVRIEGESVDYRLNGYISRPETTRANRNAMSAIVNGRFVRNYALSQAVMQAYHTLLPINRFPICLLDLRMDPTLVDVNVHPAKLEVRFSKESELVRFVSDTLRQELQRHVLIPSGKVASPTKQAVVQERLAFPPAAPSRSAQSAYTADPSARQSVPPAPTHVRERGQEWHPSRAPVEQPSGGTVNAERFRERAKEPTKEPTKEQIERFTEVMVPDQDVRADLPSFPELYPIGQTHGTYIVAQNENGLYLIDQHAAHERINYERYFSLFGSADLASQQLLVPITIELTSGESAALGPLLYLFEQVGVYMEPFGGNTFIVRSCPEWIPEGDESAIVAEMVEWALFERKEINIAKLREKSAILCSCKASIKANQSLTIAEMDTLLGRLAQMSNPYTCPHGRPIIVSFSKHELEKMFKRVM